MKHPIKYYTLLPDPNPPTTRLFSISDFFNTRLFSRLDSNPPDIEKKNYLLGPSAISPTKIAEYLFISYAVTPFPDKRSTAAILTER